MDTSDSLVYASKPETTERMNRENFPSLATMESDYGSQIAHAQRAYEPPDMKPSSSYLIKMEKDWDGTSMSSCNRTNDTLTKCREEVMEHSKKFSNILKIKLPPTTEEEIFSVDDLHVPVILQKCEISPDLPVITEIKAQDFFRRPNNMKNKILLYGPTGGGKTTEIKKWIHSWCYNMEDNPFQDFAVVFYIDAAEMKSGSSLGKAITNQCLPAESAFSAKDVETLCRDRQSEILVILDHYTQRRKSVDDNNSLVKMVQLQDFLSLCLLVITTSDGVGDFRKIYANYDHVRVGGISVDSVSKYVHQLFKKREDETFISNVLEYIDATDLAHLMASSPVLLVILCQILKWHDVPTQIEGLKTTCLVINRLVECLTKDSDVARAGGGERKLSDKSEPGMNVFGKDERRRSSPLPLVSYIGFLDPSPKGEIFTQLSAVAFNFYFKGKCQENQNLQLSDHDFDICGDLKSKVIDEGCRLKLLYKLGEEEINPSSEQAAEGRFYKFLNPVFQQKLAAEHLSELLNGDKEDETFNETLRQIRDTSDALSWRNLLLFACGESRDAAFRIISHVVKLTEAEEKHSDPRKKDVFRECEGWYQYVLEFILELNYEAQSEGQFNDILRPVVTSMRILSPSVIMTRSLSYLLRHTAPANGPLLDKIDIEVFADSEDIQAMLPSLDHIQYTSSDVPMQLGEEDSGSQSEQPSYHKMCRLDIRVEQMKTTHTCTNQAPSAITMVAQAQNLDIPPGTQLPSTSGNGMPSNDSLPLSIPESAGHDKEIKLVRHEEIETHGDEPIAEGGFGEVFKATYRGKVYAMKRLKNIDKKSCHVAEREIKMNARVSHRNIVVLHAYAKYQLKNMGTYRYELLMEYIDGCNLEQAIFDEEQKIQHLETSKGQIELALKVSDAVAHVHANSIVHADITPYNILIKIPENEPYLCDLGLGHAKTHSALTSGRRYCVQRWSPPECSAQGYHATFEGDIWSLACTILEVFTRRKVWSDYQHDWELIDRLKQDNVVPDILSLVEDPAIQDILRRCFTKDPNERPNAQQLVDTFKQALTSV